MYAIKTTQERAGKYSSSHAKINVKVCSLALCHHRCLHFIMVGPFDANSMKIFSIKCSRARMGASETARPLNGSQSKPARNSIVASRGWQ